MKLTNKQLKKIIKEEFYNIIKETMIKPSNLVQKILDDPKVNSRVKEKVKVLFDAGDEEATKQALELVAVFHPEYTEEINSIIPGTLGSEYKVQYNRASFPQKLKARIKKVAERMGVKDLEILDRPIKNTDNINSVFVRSQNDEGLYKTHQALTKSGFKTGRLIYSYIGQAYQFPIEIDFSKPFPKGLEDLFSGIKKENKRYYEVKK
tara:strand:- start:245 stop:865 length:621 start_codon:yes stop_codon:yes gene_type:complete